MMDLTVAPTDVMISFPMPPYAARKLGRLYRMNYAPHITIASGNKLPDMDDLYYIRNEIKNWEPFRITLENLATIKVDGGHLLWAIADIPVQSEYDIATEAPIFTRAITENWDPANFPYMSHPLRPHVTLRYRKRPFRWLPKMPKISWVQRWVEIVEGDNTIHRIVIGNNGDNTIDDTIGVSHGSNA